MDPTEIQPSMLDKIPAMAPPENVIPNLINPYSLAEPGRIVIAITLSLMVFGVALRLYTRLRVTRATGADDYLCIAASASVLSYCAVTLSILGNPMGPHMWNVPLSKITPKYILGAIASTNLYAASALLLKVSILVLYLRIFQADKRARVLIWIGVVLITVFYIVCIILTSIFCRSSQWPSNISPIEFLVLQSKSDCNRYQLNLAAVQGVFSTASDIYVLIIPVNLIRGLRLPLARKVGISGIFLLGLFATGCSIATLYYRFVQRGSSDFTWDSALNLILGGVELNVGVVCSCLPVAFILFRRASTSSWASLRYWSTRILRRTRSRTTNITDPGTKPPGSASGPNGDLPKVPRGTLTGLRTFFAGTRGKSRVEATEMSTYTDLESIDEAYHA